LFPKQEIGVNQLMQINVSQQQTWRSSIQFATGLVVTLGGAAVLLAEVARLSA
jgi:hypothetical protein